MFTSDEDLSDSVALVRVVHLYLYAGLEILKLLFGCVRLGRRLYQL